MQGQHRNRDVETESPVKPARTEADEICNRMTHAIARHTNDPGARPSRVFKQPRVSGVILLVSQPSVPARLTGMASSMAVVAGR